MTKFIHELISKSLVEELNRKKNYIKKLLFHGLLIFDRIFSGFTTVFLKGFKCIHEIILHKVLMQQTDQPLLL